MIENICTYLTCFFVVVTFYRKSDLYDNLTFFALLHFLQIEDGSIRYK